jgi:spermidine synthase
MSPPNPQLMSPHPSAATYLRPFVYETRTSKILHFSICDMQSKMHIGRPHELVLAYTRLVMGFLLFSPTPSRLLMVGLGGGSMAKFCHKYLPATCIEVAEINPYVIALRHEFEVPDDDERFHVRLEDAADYIRTSEAPCDVIIADGFDANGLPASLCSRSFYENCFDLLSPSGVLVANLHCDHEHYPVYLARLMKSFAGQVVVVNDYDGTNVIAFAFKDSDGQRSERPLSNLDALAPEAWDQLAPSFARVKSAINDFCNGTRVLIFPALTHHFG